MDILVVESRLPLAEIWSRHLLRAGCTVRIAAKAGEACEVMREHSFNVIVLDLELAEGDALSVADFAGMFQPKARVVFVSANSFFADGSIFSMFGNACAFLPRATDPGDLSLLVRHYGSA